MTATFLATLSGVLAAELVISGVKLFFAYRRARAMRAALQGLFAAPPASQYDATEMN